MDVGVWGNTISLIFAVVAFILFTKLDPAADIATGFKDDIHALISGFKSAIGIGGLKGVSFEIKGVITVAAVIEIGLADADDAIVEFTIIEGCCSTMVGELLMPSSLASTRIPTEETFCKFVRLLLN